MGSTADGGGAACQGAAIAVLGAAAPATSKERLAEVERLSAAGPRARKRNVGVGDTGAARLNEEMLCS